MPRAGTRVIPVTWDVHHRPTAENIMAATTVALRRPSSAATFDEAAGRSVYPEPSILATDVVARIQRLSRRGGAAEIGERWAVEQIYQVSIPAGSPEVRTNDQVLVLTSESDPTLVDKLLRIHEVRLGSNLWQRDLMCEETTPTTR